MLDLPRRRVGPYTLVGPCNSTPWEDILRFGPTRFGAGVYITRAAPDGLVCLLRRQAASLEGGPRKSMLYSA